MFLGIDVGNSNTTIGIVSKGEIKCLWRIRTEKDITPDELRITLSSLFATEAVSPNLVKHAAVSSVVPTINRALGKAIKDFLNIEALFVGPGTRTGIKLRVKNPAELGPDRVVNAAAAHFLVGGNLIVIDLGTATTIDYVTEEGEFMGGAIAPGMAISSEALFSKTAKLPRVEFKKPDSVIGKSTVESIQSGLFYGYISLVKGIVDKMKSEIKRPVKTVATGGCINEMRNYLGFVDVLDEFLTVKGLYIIAMRNKGEL